MAEIPNIPDIPEKVAEKLPTMEQWRKYGSSSISYVFMLCFFLYFFYSEFIKRDDCGEKIASFEKVIKQKDVMIEQLNTRVLKLETALDVKNGIIQKVEEKVSSDIPQVGGSR